MGRRRLEWRWSVWHGRLRKNLGGVLRRLWRPTSMGGPGTKRMRVVAGGDDAAVCAPPIIGYDFHAQSRRVERLPPCGVDEPRFLDGRHPSVPQRCFDQTSRHRAAVFVRETQVFHEVWHEFGVSSHNLLVRERFSCEASLEDVHHHRFNA